MNKYYTFNEYIKENDLTPSEEDYIEMIYRLQLKNNCVKVAELAKSLNVKTPSASNMVKRLNDKGLLIHENYGNLNLNDKGFKVGKSLLLRHNSIEDFLKIIGVKDNLHEETEKIEHTISDETLKSIIHLVNFFNEKKEIHDIYNIYIELN
jgi:Mn-dependent DtxR family transcriptional regulator